MKIRSSLKLVVIASSTAWLAAEEPPRESIRTLPARQGAGADTDVQRALDPAMPYAYLAPGDAAKGQYELSIDDLLTLVAELREAAAQALACGRTRVPINTIEALVQDKAIEPVLLMASHIAAVPYLRVKRPALSAVETRAIIAQVRARANKIRAAKEITRLSYGD